MKKTISLILVAVMCLTFASCSALGGRKKVRELADIAPSLTCEEFWNVYKRNGARAKDEFDGKVYRISGEIFEVSEDYCYINDRRTKVYLEKEELLKLDRGEYHTFVGVLDVGAYSKLSVKYAILLYD